jgi:lipoyl(octanoyl) transferase
MKKILFEDIGKIEYSDAWNYQQQLLTDLQNRDKTTSPEFYGHLLLCEHPHVYTLGKSGSINNLLVNETVLKEKGATFYKTDRGGDITYHGPGQIVGYPIIDLNAFGIGVKEYVYRIEETIIRTLREFGISTERLSGATGVWLDVNSKKVRKICAIGVRVSRGITMHGFALNVNTDLSFFNFINPCGFTDKTVTSIQKEIGHPQGMDEVKTIFIKFFEEVFEVIIDR